MKNLSSGVCRYLAFAALSGTVAVAAAPAAASTDDEYAVPAVPAVAPLCLTGVGTLACIGVGAAAVTCYFLCDDLMDMVNGMMAEHTRNRRGSTSDKHQAGQSRKQRDQKRKEEREKKRKRGGR